jgi:hypothetical protein
MKRLVFSDTDEGAKLYGNLFTAYFSSQFRAKDEENLHRAVKILQAAEKISEPRENGDGRRLVRGTGDQVLMLEDAEYEFLKARVMEFGWPLLWVEEGQKVRAFVVNAGDVKLDDD